MKAMPQILLELISNLQVARYSAGTASSLNIYLNVMGRLYDKMRVLGEAFISDSLFVGRSLNKQCSVLSNYTFSFTGIKHD